MLKNIYFIRHGETSWNAEGRVLGRTDIPLNANGLLQAESAKQNIQDKKIEVLYVSPLKRAQMTAEHISKHIHVPCVFCDDLQEMLFGNLEGKTAAEIEKEYGDAIFKKLITLELESDVMCHHKMETHDQLRQRALTALTQIGKSPYQNIGIVGHAMFIRHFLKTLFVPVSFHVHNGAVLHFTYDTDKNKWCFQK